MPFCDSPYLSQANYADTLCELTALFYVFKSDIEDEMTDDELLDAMRDLFNHRAQGALEYLADITLSDLCRMQSSDDARLAYNEDEAAPWKIR